ncbi:hypothetical protein MRB53_035333 [Persea americana]|uniref:Uncharacterized protein n=1 Tax=Persea americana TaxID=3435 RepID=A0ACC2K4F2_PERAE|nr:hypothetical protein MRB53_035333 [Persea americana]
MKGGHRRIFRPPVDAQKDRDDDLLLFHEMRRREKERSVNLLLVSDELESNSGNYPLYRIPSAMKGAGNEFFPFESDKNDYDWLKTPPATPLFPSLEMEAAGANFVMQREIPILQPIKHSRFAGHSTSEAPKPIFTPKSTNLKSRSATPNTKPSVTIKPPQTNKPISVPTQKSTQPTPDTRKKSNFPSISAKPMVSNQASSNIGPETSNPKHRPNVTDRPKSRGVSPLVRSRIPATIPGFSYETPPNLRTSAPSDRSTSASRGRPVNPIAGSDRAPSATRVRPMKAIAGSDRAPSATRVRPANPTSLLDRASSATRVRPGNQTTEMKQEGGKAGRQSCSPSMARGRRPELRKEGKLEGGNGFVLGSRMVEKVVNARKSGRGEEQDPRPKFLVSGVDGSGFGRLMSKSSLDMALKHMEIKRNPSNFRHYNTILSGRNSTSTTTSCNSSLSSSPRTSARKEEEIEDEGGVK